jgi:general secretion pathway protein M
MKQQFLSWWFSLQQREQRLVAGAAVVCAIAVFYWMIWQPLHQANVTQQQKVQLAKRQLAELQQLLPKLKAAGETAQRSGGSLPQIISNSARGAGISVSRMQPQNDQLTMVLEDVSFAQLLAWLHTLQYQHGVNLINLDVAIADKPGIVRVRRMVVE